MNKSPKANESFLPVTHRSAGSVGNSNSSSSSGRHGYANGSNIICSMITFFPLQAIQRMLQCFGYSHTIQMQSGRTIAVGGELAQGGYSFVYTAHDPMTGETFALKKILCQTKEQIQMARQEIQIHKSFSHPHIMPLDDYTVLTAENSRSQEYYLLFPFMENGTLRELIDRNLSAQKFSSESFLLEMFLKICRGVAELHSKSPPLAHRDIKPENILLTEDYEPILTDFGSVTEAEVLISSRSEALLLQEHAAQFSSMAYRAPELYDVQDVAKISTKTDVWALGCLLFAMAFGYSPFECTFHKETGEVRVIECTYLGVIGSIRFPRTHPFSVQFCDLISWMLTQDVVTRPNIFQVIERVHPLVP